MTEFEVTEYVTITVKRTYYVEAENSEEAIGLVMGGKCEKDHEVEIDVVQDDYEVDERW